MFKPERIPTGDERRHLMKAVNIVTKNINSPFDNRLDLNLAAVSLQS